MLDEQRQETVTSELSRALQDSGNADIKQTILNLAEFMDHSEKGPLPIAHKALADEAFETRVYAKALRYCELAIIKNNNVIEEVDCTKLIS